MKNKRTGKQVVISVLIVVVWAALGLTTGTRRGLCAATFTVMNLNDNGAGSLRQAIIDANATAGADTIDFQAGLTGTITLASALPQITQDLTINGPGADVVTVSGASAFQVFNIAGGVTVSISGLTISNGNAGFFSSGGGGAQNFGTLTVTNSTFSFNSAAGNGGGILNNTGGTLTVTNSTFSFNSAAGNGGGINNTGGTLTVTNSTLSFNSAAGSGGGIVNLGTLTITDSSFSGNSASIGGGISNLVGMTLTVTNSTFSLNSASLFTSRRATRRKLHVSPAIRATPT